MFDPSIQMLINIYATEPQYINVFSLHVVDPVVEADHVWANITSSTEMLTNQWPILDRSICSLGILEHNSGSLMGW